MSRAQLSISKAQCLSNINNIKRHLNCHTKLLAVVKSNAYGCGVKHIVPLLRQTEFSYLGVATVKEAVEILEFENNLPILLLSEPLFDEWHILPESVEFTVYSLEFLMQLLNNSAKRNIKVHLKLNTGLNRLGADLQCFWDLWDQMQAAPNIEIVGVCTHLVESEIIGSVKTDAQIQEFEKVVKRCKSESSSSLIAHISNSAGLAIQPSIEMDMVRIGLSLYHNVLKLESRVLHVRRVLKGETVSYSQQFTAITDTTVAILAIGYSDGIPSSTDSLCVTINGRTYPVIGRICMDMICVDLGDDSCTVGDTAIIFDDTNGSSKNTLNGYALKTKQNPREAICKIGDRVTRVMME